MARPFFVAEKTDGPGGNGTEGRGAVGMGAGIVAVHFGGGGGNSGNGGPDSPG